MSLLIIHSLGRHSPLGRLYDARTDTFLKAQLVNPTISIDTYSKKTNAHFRIEQTHLDDETLSNQFKLLRISPELAASILAGTARAKGSAKYLDHKLIDGRRSERALRRSVTGLQERIDLTSEHVKRAIALQKNELNRATHVLTEITWGTECVVTISGKKGVRTREDAKGRSLDTCLRRLQSTAMKHGTKVGIDEAKSFDDELDLLVYGDLLEDRNPLPAPFVTVVDTLASLSKFVARDGQGHQIVYTLMPVEAVHRHTSTKLGSLVFARELSADVLSRIVRTFDRLVQTDDMLKNCSSSLQAHRSYVPHSHIKAIFAARKSLADTATSFQAKFSRYLKEIRHKQASEKGLSDLLKHTDDTSQHKDIIYLTTKFTKILSFINDAVALGAVYVGYNGKRLGEGEFHQHRDAYLFHFSERASRQTIDWLTLTTRILDILRNSTQRPFVVLADYDATGEYLSRPLLTEFRNGNATTRGVSDIPSLFWPDKLISRSEHPRKAASSSQHKAVSTSKSSAPSLKTKSHQELATRTAKNTTTAAKQPSQTQKPNNDKSSDKRPTNQKNTSSEGNGRSKNDHPSKHSRGNILSNYRGGNDESADGWFDDSSEDSSSEESSSEDDSDDETYDEEVSNQVIPYAESSAPAPHRSPNTGTSNSNSNTQVSTWQNSGSGYVTQEINMPGLHIRQSSSEGGSQYIGMNNGSMVVAQSGSSGASQVISMGHGGMNMINTGSGSQFIHMGQRGMTIVQTDGSESQVISTGSGGMNMIGSGTVVFNNVNINNSNSNDTGNVLMNNRNAWRNLQGQYWSFY